jgi:hypothetical protein
LGSPPFQIVLLAFQSRAFFKLSAFQINIMTGLEDLTKSLEELQATIARQGATQAQLLEDNRLLKEALHGNQANMETLLEAAVTASQAKARAMLPPAPGDEILQRRLNTLGDFFERATSILTLLNTPDPDIDRSKAIAGELVRLLEVAIAGAAGSMEVAGGRLRSEVADAYYLAMRPSALARPAEDWKPLTTIMPDSKHLKHAKSIVENAFPGYDKKRMRGGGHGGGGGFHSGGKGQGNSNGNNQGGGAGGGYRRNFSNFGGGHNNQSKKQSTGGSAWQAKANDEGWNKSGS